MIYLSRQTAWDSQMSLGVPLRWAVKPFIHKAAKIQINKIKTDMFKIRVIYSVQCEPNLLRFLIINKLKIAKNM